MNRLSVRLFASYVVIVLVSTGVVFVTARALAPTFFRVELQQGREEAPTGSTFRRSQSETTTTSATTSTRIPGERETPTTGAPPATPQSTSPPQPSTTHHTDGPGPATTRHQEQPGTTTDNRGHGGSPDHDDGGEGLGAATGTFAAAAPATTVVEIDDEINEAFLSAIDRSLVTGLIVALVIAVIASWMVSQWLTRPIGDVRRATVRLAEGRYSERVPVPAEADLAALAGDVNQLAETLEATEARRARLISDVAHELRTPLTTIQGSMEGLMDGVLAPSDEVYASVAEEAARLQRVVADLGLLSRLDESALVLDIAPSDVGEVAAQVVERLRPQYEDQGVGLVTSGLHGLAVEADADRLAQVFTNLIGNALAHTGEGGTVSVSGRRADATVEVVVSDNGDGIEEGELDKIFERFHRGRRNRRPGSGLGLTIARSIARAHGGEVTATSPGPGRGASFTVVLPSTTPTSSSAWAVVGGAGANTSA